VVRFLDVASEFGVEAVKFTGGEPMLRGDLAEIIDRTPERMETSMTTNGTFLPGRATELVEAGLDRVNVSQDALDPEAFAEITKSGAYDRVVEGVEAALDAGLAPVKLNMVVFKHTAGYVEGMVDHVAENDGLQLQLIEYMPELTGRPEWAIDIGRVHDWLEEVADSVERREMHDRRRYFVGGGMVEIVDPVGNETFCANCHRVRVTHDGKLKGCLNRTDDLKPMGETNAEMRETFRQVVHDRVPYYGEYMIRDGEGGWEVNEAYLPDDPAEATSEEATPPMDD
jgi:cyclic pyranopterin phosphate synthase